MLKKILPTVAGSENVVIQLFGLSKTFLLPLLHMSIALFSLTSPLHRETAPDASSEPFIKGIEKELGDTFLFFGEDYSTYGTHTADIIYVRTGGTEGIFKALGLTRSGSRCAGPDVQSCGSGTAAPAFLLLTSGESNSLAASMEILSWLRQQGLSGEILHGSAGYIASRISSISKSSDAAEVSSVAGSPEPFIRPLPEIDLGGIRLGVIGKPSDWLISSDVDYTKAKSRLNAEIVDIPMSELLNRLPSCKTSPKEHPAGPDSEAVDMRSFAGSEAIFDALLGIIRDYRLGGLTLRCFDLLGAVHNTGCLALARLNAQGIPSSCEGDIPALLSMVYLQQTTGCPGFQCNLSRCTGDELLFAHCTVPLNMVTSYSHTTHFESGLGTAIKGELPTGDVEIFKISPDLEHCVRIPGRLLRNTSEPNLCRTQVVVSAPGAASYLLRSPLANHHILHLL